MLRWSLVTSGKSKVFSSLSSADLLCTKLFLKSEFGLAFLDAKERCNARTRHGTFDTNVLEIKKEDLDLFLQTLCEGVRR